MGVADMLNELAGDLDSGSVDLEADAADGVSVAQVVAKDLRDAATAFESKSRECEQLKREVSRIQTNPVDGSIDFVGMLGTAEAQNRRLEDDLAAAREALEKADRLALSCRLGILGPCQTPFSEDALSEYIKSRAPAKGATQMPIGPPNLLISDDGTIARAEKESSDGDT